MELREYLVNSRICLVGADATNKAPATYGILSFSVMAEDFDKATQLAESLLPDEEYELTGVGEA